MFKYVVKTSADRRFLDWDLWDEEGWTKTEFVVEAANLVEAGKKAREMLSKTGKIVREIRRE